MKSIIFQINAKNPNWNLFFTVNVLKLNKNTYFYVVYFVKNMLIKCLIVLKITRSFTRKIYQIVICIWKAISCWISMFPFVCILIWRNYSYFSIYLNLLLHVSHLFTHFLYMCASHISWGSVRSLTVEANIILFA